MGIHRHQLLGRRDEPLDSTWHLLQAMRLLRRDLDDAKTKTQQSGTIGMITVVISLAIRANLVGAPAEGRTYLHALQRIVELRPGGLVASCTVVAELGNKIRRTDTELDWQPGQGPSLDRGTAISLCLCHRLYPSCFHLR